MPYPFSSFQEIPQRMVRGWARAVFLFPMCLFASSWSHAELQVANCVEALRMAQSKIACTAAYKTTTSAEFDLIDKLSYGLVRKSTCEVKINFDVPALAAQYRAGAQLKLLPVQMDCVMETRAANLPITLEALTRVHINAQGMADAFTAQSIDVVGYPDIYESQILRFVNDNRDLGKDVVRIFNENLSVLASHAAIKSLKR